MDSPGFRPERFHLLPGIQEARGTIDDDSFEDATVGIEFADNFDTMACVTEFRAHVRGENTRYGEKNQNGWDCVRVKAVDVTAQEKILEELNRRWLDATLDEDFRSKARLLVMMLSAVMDVRGEVPEQHWEYLRTRVEELTRDLPRIDSLLVLQKAAAAIKLVSDSLPDPSAGTGFHKRLAEEEIAAIRLKHPPLKLRPAAPGNHAFKANGTNGMGLPGSEKNGNGTHEEELLEDMESVNETDTREGEEQWRSTYNPLMGPGQGWVHRPRRGYGF
jgi:hypothetical protein